MPQAASITVGFISLGCAKNLVDSEIMATLLMDSGFRLSPDPEHADVVIVNTCAFIHDAREESVDTILEACSWKQGGRCRAVLVAGCLPQRYRRQIRSLLPEVDAFIGVDDLYQVGAVIGRVLRGERSLAVIAPVARAVLEPPENRLTFTGAPYAYLKIAEGCNHTCAFCAIPGIRGRYRSRQIDSIVAEAEGLLSRGIRELTLIAQDTTWYGKDLGSSTNLAVLLRALGRIGGRFWIRLLYCHPAYVTAELLDAMSAVGQVCDYLDLPIQHGDNAVLRAMRRPTTAESMRQTFRQIRAALPHVTLRTTCLIGFPGETEQQYRNLLDFLDEIRFNHVAVFTYSREEGTPAAKLRPSVPPAEAERRKKHLMRRQRRVVAENARAQIGKSDRLLLERYDCRRHRWVARSCAQAPDVDGCVFVEAPAHGFKPGSFIKARYVAAAGYDLQAVIHKS